LDHADWQWIATEYQTGVEEGTGSRSSWRVVATDLSCLRVMMMMMIVSKEHAPTDYLFLPLSSFNYIIIYSILFYSILLVNSFTFAFGNKLSVEET